MEKSVGANSIEVPIEGPRKVSSERDQLKGNHYDDCDDPPIFKQSSFECGGAPTKRQSIHDQGDHTNEQIRNSDGHQQHLCRSYAPPIDCEEHIGPDNVARTVCEPLHPEQVAH